MTESIYTTYADLGGQHGHGRIVPESEGNPFHTTWEARAFALTLAAGATGMWNLDMSRSARETLHEYIKLPYYEIWFTALVNLLIRYKMITSSEASTGKVKKTPIHVPKKLIAANVVATLMSGAPTLRTVSQPARFALGDRVRLSSQIFQHHTRLPEYVRGKVGVIECIHGAHVFADSNSRGTGENPQWLYSVIVHGTDIWPDREDAGEANHLTVSIDAWEPYLELA